jgi:hypothetical protein
MHIFEVFLDTRALCRSIFVFLDTRGPRARVSFLFPSTNTYSLTSGCLNLMVNSDYFRPLEQQESLGSRLNLLDVLYISTER